MVKKRQYKTSAIQVTGTPGGPDPFYIKKGEAYSPDWEGEWESVQRRRADGDPLMRGGRARSIFHTRLQAMFG